MNLIQKDELEVISEYLLKKEKEGFADWRDIMQHELMTLNLRMLYTLYELNREI